MNEKVVASSVASGQSSSSGLLHSEQWFVLAAAFLGWMFDGLEMGIFPLVARPALQDLMRISDDALVGLWNARIVALFLMGAACGGLIFGWCGDRLGRVRAMVISILTYSIFSGLCYFATAPWQLGVLRFVAALGMGGEWALGVALVMECWPAQYRPMLAGTIGAAANVGFTLIALLGRFIPVTRQSWRWVMVAGAVPALLGFFISLCVPESKRWKESVEKKASRPMAEIWRLRLGRRTLLAVAFSSIALMGTWGSVQWLPLWADQLTGGVVPSAKANTQMLSGLGAIVGCFVAPWIGGRFGRRPAYFFLCLVSLISCTYLFRGVGSYGSLFLLMCFVVGGVTASFYGWLPLYLPELFPTRVRATGQGLSYNFGRILAAIGALEMGTLMRFYQGSYAKAGATITLVYLLGLVLIWLAPETKGQPLPD